MHKENEALAQLVKRIKESLGETAVLEYRFHEKRRWRFDLAIPSLMIALEVQGGLFVKGRHVQGDGAEKDHVKMNFAQLLGWIVIQCQPRQINSPEVMNFLVTAVQRQREYLADWTEDDRVELMVSNQADGAANGRPDGAA